MSGQRGFFDIDERYAALSAAGDPLQRLASVVDFDVFRPVLDAALARSDGANAADRLTTRCACSRSWCCRRCMACRTSRRSSSCATWLSFMRFVGLELHDPVPDAKTVWLYREQLKRADAIDTAFFCGLELEGFLEDLDFHRLAAEQAS